MHSVDAKPNEYGPRCPHLGLEDDAFQKLAEPSPRHRCYLWMQRDRIDLAHQANFCLAPAHAACPWLSISTPGSSGRVGDATGSSRALATLRSLGLTLWGWLLVALAALAHAAVAAGRWLWSNAARFARFLLAQLVRGSRALGRWLRDALRSAWISLRADRQPPPAPSVAVAEVSEPPAEQVAPADGPAVIPPPATSAAVAFEQGMLAMRQGNRQQAYGLFVQASEMPDALEDAWLWRGALAESIDEKRHCLRQVLAINPESTRASAALRQLEADAASSTPEPVAVASSTVAAATAADPPPAPTPAPSTVAARAPIKPSVKVIPVTWQCDVCLNSNPSSSRVCRTCGSPSPEVEAQMKASGEALLEEGVAALKLGNEEAAYRSFVAACEANPQSELAWYWRAKTAETLDEVISSLEQALAINPDNPKVQADLESARRRQAHTQMLAAAVAPKEAPPPPPGPTAAQRLGRALLGLMPQLAGLAAFALCLFWLSPAILARAADVFPAELVPVEAVVRDLQPYVPALALPPLPVVTPWAWIPKFDFAPVIPYLVAAICFYAAYLLVDRRPKSRFWGPAAGLLGIVLGFIYVTNMTAIVISAALCVVLVLAALLSWRELTADTEKGVERQRFSPGQAH